MGLNPEGLLGPLVEKKIKSLSVFMFLGEKATLFIYVTFATDRFSYDKPGTKKLTFVSLNNIEYDPESRRVSFVAQDMNKASYGPLTVSGTILKKNMKTAIFSIKRTDSDASFAMNAPFSLSEQENDQSQE
jgi:hypothetical protein